MRVEAHNRAIDDWLGRARSYLPVRRGDDILRELESSIRDRVDDLAEREGRDADQAIVERALTEIGSPEEVARAYVRDRYVVAPDQYRSFVLYTAIVFVLHLVMVGVATTTGRAFHVGPFAISPVGPHGVISLAANALHALLLDVGLMVVVFVGAAAARRTISARPLLAGVESSPRTAGGRALLAVLVTVVLNFFRDDVFVVMNDGIGHPLFTPWFGIVLPFVTGVLLLGVVIDVLYMIFGERRLTLALDAFHGAFGIACMLHLMRGDPLLALPPIDAFHDFHEPVNLFLEQLAALVAGFLALLFAVKTVRRLVRFAQL